MGPLASPFRVVPTTTVVTRDEISDALLALPPAQVARVWRMIRVMAEAETVARSLTKRRACRAGLSRPVLIAPAAQLAPRSA